MEINPIFMDRCLQLALKGEGFTKPNPLVGAVIVHCNKVIGEGYHRQYGGPHAEANAIASVKDVSLLRDSTLYVSLEPCSHHGKTPPCAQMIVSNNIPRVVLAIKDPNPAVSGKGIEIMSKNGIDVTVGVMGEEARELNKMFFVNQLFKRPFVMLKWAQSKDGFIDVIRDSIDDMAPAKISNSFTNTVVHKFRTHAQGIIVGTKTALLDNPQLTARKWFGPHPTRIVIDRENKIPANSALFDGSSPAIVFTASAPAIDKDNKQVKYIEIDFTKDTNRQILSSLYNEKIYSLLVEGGTSLLNSFIEKNLWDEAYVEISDKKLFSGVKAPEIKGKTISVEKYLNSLQFHLKSEITRNFL
ncbi:MAG: bifunctional diaminohydroxyphosphoribosylaminopyrimidine deaminase/5-amino-6-(5-phosphoribosylamino)uracil reductase RibD [Proteiniphilum sp.]|nr:bifunctional diaminohydroxyphosphoribosylaminopyrimidine deaminase/5-amino-6-(5-phosphoribosylamino)uracil reductase RibD [Proteiniphilum sp.]